MALLYGDYVSDRMTSDRWLKVREITDAGHISTERVFSKFYIYFRVTGTIENNQMKKNGMKKF